MQQQLAIEWLDIGMHTKEGSGRNEQSHVLTKWSNHHNSHHDHSQLENNIDKYIQRICNFIIDSVDVSTKT